MYIAARRVRAELHDRRGVLRDVLWPSNLEAGYQPLQPLPFSHQLHAGDMKIPCLYCHSEADRGQHATVPRLSTSTSSRRMSETLPQRQASRGHSSIAFGHSAASLQRRSERSGACPLSQLRQPASSYLSQFLHVLDRLSSRMDNRRGHPARRDGPGVILHCSSQDQMRPRRCRSGECYRSPKGRMEKPCTG